MAIDAKSLRHAIALADAGHYGVAARALHVSQPALSRSIARLEARLGVRLFDRGRRGVTPTRFGELLVRRGRGLMTGLEDIGRELALMQGAHVGELSVAAGLYPAEMSVGTAIGRLSAAHPGLRIVLKAAPWREVAAAVTAGTVDIAVVELSALAGDRGLVRDPLPRHDACFACRPGHPLLAERSLTLKKIFAFPFAGPRLPPRIARPVRPAAAHLPFDATDEDLVPPLHVESIALAKRIVMAGNAIAALPQAVIAAELRAGTLAALPWRPAWLHTGYGFVYRRDRTLSPATLAFMAAVRAAEAELAPQGDARARGGRRPARRGA